MMQNQDDILLMNDAKLNYRLLHWSQQQNHLGEVSTPEYDIAKGRFIYAPVPPQD